jgi:hypothetical protein
MDFCSGCVQNPGAALPSFDVGLSGELAMLRVSDIYINFVKMPLA